MKKIMLFVMALWWCEMAWADSAAKDKCTMDGKAIIDKQSDLHRSNYEMQEQEIVLVDVKSDVKEKRKLKQLINNSEEGNAKILISFLEPADIRGSAFLSWKHPDAESDQWLYLPALKKLQRIASGSKKKYFLGTDFSFADLDGEKTAENSYNCQKEEVCETEKDKTCFVVEVLPKNPKFVESSGYSKRILHIRKDIFVTSHIKFFDEKGELFKTLTSYEWEKVGTVFRPNKAVMDRLNTHKTYVRVSARQLNKKIEDSVFSEKYITNEMHMK